MTAAASHQPFEVTHPSQVGEARRAAVRMAELMGFDEVATGRVALVVTELGTNLARHAVRGRLFVAPRASGDESHVEVLSVDDGPGMDVARCMADGFSTGGTAGSGLGAVRRLADMFDAFSTTGQGTVIAAHIGMRRAAGAARPAASHFVVGGMSLNAPGETVCGDAWSFVQQGDQAALLVADGLGHGHDASVAARLAVDRFEQGALRSPSVVLDEAHGVMRSSRGAAASIARLDADAGAVSFSGVGNVVGRIVSGVEDRTLLSQHGTLGLQIRKLHDAGYVWPDHAVVVLYSDGVVTRWSLSAIPGILKCHPSVLACWLVTRHLRGKDDATAVVVRRA